MIIRLLIIAMMFIHSTAFCSYRLSLLSADNILSQHASEKIIQDNKGYIWISSYDGLNKFNGFENKIYQFERDNPRSIAGNRVVSLFEDNHRDILVGLDGEGFCRHNSTTDDFDRFYFDGGDQGAIGGVIRTISQMADGSYIFGSKSGFAIVRESDMIGERIERYQSYVTSSVINDIQEVQFGKLLVATRDGLNLCDLRGGVMESENLLRANTNQIYFDKVDPQWWICTQAGLYTYNNREIVSIKVNGKKGGVYRAITRDLSGNLWCYSNLYGLGRLEKIDAANYRFTPIETINDNYFSGNVITSLIVDHTNNLWIGSRYRGVAFIDLSSGSIRSVLNNKPNGANVIRSVTKGGEYLWVGSITNGLTRFKIAKDGSLSDETHPLPGVNMIFDLYAQVDKAIWVCSQMSLYRADIQPDKNGVHTFKNISSDHLRGIHHRLGKPLAVVGDSYGYIWISFHLGVISIDKDFNIVEQINYAAEEQTRMFWDDENSSIWLCSRHSGLRAMRVNESGRILMTKSYNDRGVEANSLSSSHIWDVARSRFGSEILIASDTGIEVLNPQTSNISHFSPIELNSHKIAGFSQDSNGDLWLNTTKGLMRYNSNYEQVKIYDYQNGLASSTLTEASLLLYDSLLYVGTIAGLSYVNINKLHYNLHENKLDITDFLVGNTSLRQNPELDLSGKGEREIALEHNENNVTIKFNALQFANASKVKYRYTLEDYDAEWVEIGAQNPQARYRRLPAGRYKFKVIACNNDGVWSEDPLVVTFRVKRSPLLSTTALIIYLLLLIAITILIRRQRRARAMRRQQELIRQLKEKSDRDLADARISCYNDITHELRHPITMIYAPLEDMKRMDLPYQVEKSVSLMSFNVGKLLNIVNQYLDMQKIDLDRVTLKIEYSDIISHIKRVKEGFNHIAEHNNIQYSMICDNSSRECWFDREKLDTIINNLLSNAFKYTPEGRTITLFVDLTPDEKVCITVEDSGLGIEEDELEKIFERHYRAKNHRDIDGNGIGLDIVKRLIELNHGAIEVSSSPNVGSSFKVTLPIDKESFEEVDLCTPVSSVIVGSFVNDGNPEVIEVVNDKEFDDSKHLLVIIEDDVQLCNYMSERLSEMFQVIKAYDGLSGLDLVMRHIPDIVISDVMMPQMDGVEVCRAIKNDFKTSHIPVILLTARDMDRDIERGLQFGAHDYIIKPFSIDMLMMKVNNILISRDKLRLTFGKQDSEDLQQKELLDGGENKFITKVKELLYEHIEDIDFGVDSLSKELAISRMQLYRKVKALTGISISEYLKELRLQRAKELLESGDYNVSEVSYRVGFNNHSYFTKSFKQLFDLLPSDITKRG